MALGHKTGGRAAGTPNRKTKEVKDVLESLGCDPVEGMARIAMNAKHPPELRGRMHAELAQYLYPKRKAIHLVEDAPVQTTRIQVVFAGESDDNPVEILGPRLLSGNEEPR
jgi:hypothetical protein